MFSLVEQVLSPWYQLKSIFYFSLNKKKRFFLLCEKAEIERERARTGTRAGQSVHFICAFD